MLHSDGTPGPRADDKGLALALSFLFGAAAGLYSFWLGMMVWAFMDQVSPREPGWPVVTVMSAVAITAGTRLYRFLRQRQKAGLPLPRLSSVAARDDLSQQQTWMPPRVEETQGVALSDRDLQAQARRIRAKCGRLRREALKAGGVYSSMSIQAGELAEQAESLARTVADLRRAAREIGARVGGNPVLPPGVPESCPDGALMDEIQAAQQAQARLDALMAENQQRVLTCIAQMERIEDLVDAARLEVLSPQLRKGPGERPEIAQQVEAEMRASRYALDEVRRDQRAQELES